MKKVSKLKICDLFFLLLLFDLGVISAVLRDYSLLFAKGSLLVVLRRPDGVLRIELTLAAYNQKDPSAIGLSSPPNFSISLVFCL